MHPHVVQHVHLHVVGKFVAGLLATRDVSFLVVGAVLVGAAILTLAVIIVVVVVSPTPTSALVPAPTTSTSGWLVLTMVTLFSAAIIHWLSGLCISMLSSANQKEGEGLVCETLEFH